MKILDRFIHGWTLFEIWNSSNSFKNWYFSMKFGLKVNFHFYTTFCKILPIFQIFQKIRFYHICSHLLTLLEQSYIDQAFRFLIRKTNLAKFLVSQILTDFWKIIKNSVLGKKCWCKQNNDTILSFFFPFFYECLDLILPLCFLFYLI